MLKAQLGVQADEAQGHGVVGGGGGGAEAAADHLLELALGQRQLLALLGSLRRDEGVVG